MIRLKRIYAPPSAADGQRILVERLWPRGMGKEQARLDGWMKDIAPSPALRRWFAHDPGRWEEFQTRYRAELAAREPLLEDLRARAAKGVVTFVYAARDEVHNSAVALKAYLEEHP